jgi:hypothetical protein
MLNSREITRCSFFWTGPEAEFTEGVFLYGVRGINSAPTIRTVLQERKLFFDFYKADKSA